MTVMLVGLMSGCGIDAQRLTAMRSAQPAALTGDVSDLADLIVGPVRDDVLHRQAMDVAVVLLTRPSAKTNPDPKLSAARARIEQRLVALAKPTRTVTAAIAFIKPRPSEVRSAIADGSLRGWAIACLGRLDGDRHAGLLADALLDDGLQSNDDALYGAALGLAAQPLRLASDDSLASRVLRGAAHAVGRPGQSDKTAYVFYHLCLTVARPQVMLHALSDSPGASGAPGPDEVALIHNCTSRVLVTGANRGDPPPPATSAAVARILQLLRPEAKPHPAVRRESLMRLALIDPVAVIATVPAWPLAGGDASLARDAFDALLVADHALAIASGAGRRPVPGTGFATFDPELLHPGVRIAEVRAAAAAGALPLAERILAAGGGNAEERDRFIGVLAARWPQAVEQALITGGLEASVPVDLARLHLVRLLPLLLADGHPQPLPALVDVLERCLRRADGDQLIAVVDAEMPASAAGLRVDAVLAAPSGQGDRALPVPLIGLLLSGLDALAADAAGADGLTARVPRLVALAGSQVRHGGVSGGALAVALANRLGSQHLVAVVAAAVLNGRNLPTVADLALLGRIARAARAERSLWWAGVRPGLLRALAGDDADLSLAAAALLVELTQGDDALAAAVAPPVLARWPRLAGNP